MEKLEDNAKEQLEILVKATTKLTSDVNIKSVELDNKTDLAKESLDLVNTNKVEIINIKNSINTIKNEIDKIINDTQIKISDKINLKSTADKSPVADHSGHIDHKWLNPVIIPTPDFSLPLIENLYIEHGKGTPVKIDISPNQDGSKLINHPNLFQADFTRNSDATYIDRGVIKKAKVNEPRFETDINGNPLGILIEGASTNYWTGNLTLHESVNASDVNISTAPWVCKKILRTGSATGQFVYHTLTETTTPNFNDTITTTVYLANWSNDNLTLTFQRNGAGVNKRLKIVISSGEIKEKSEDVECNHKRHDSLVIISFTTKGGVPSSGNVGINAYLDGTVDDFITLIGYQVEKLPFASSYIPTNGSAVTRNSETLQLDPTILSWLNDYTLALVCDVKRLGGIWGYGLPKQSTEPVKYSAFGYYSEAQRKFEYRSVKGQTYSPIVDLNVTSVICFRQSEKNRVFSNGNSTSDILKNIENPTDDIDDFFLGRRYESFSHSFCHIKDFKIWNRALTDEQIYFLGKEND